MRKKSKLPKWVIKAFRSGKECEDLCFVLVNIGVFYVLGILYLLVYDPIESKFIIKTAFLVAILIFLIIFDRWLIKKVTLLEILRKNAMTMYKNSKAEEDISKSKLEL